MRTTDIGRFEIISGEVIVGDPCYDLGGCGHGLLGNVHNGTWAASIAVIKKTGWGNRVAALDSAWVGSRPTSSKAEWRQEPFLVGVDSGQAGFFDARHYGDHKAARGILRIGAEAICAENPWYSLCCDRSCSSIGAGVIPFGVVSSSGYGDGAYRCHTVVDAAGTITAIKLVFIKPR